MVTSTAPVNAPETPAARPGASAEVVCLVGELVAELHPARSQRLRVGEGSRLDRDLGLDSLAQAELLLRIERRLDVHLPDGVLGRAETVADLVAAVGRAAGRPVRAKAIERAPAPEPLAEAPETAATLVEALDWHARQHPERTHALLLRRGGEPRALTYGELAEGARAVARGLRAWEFQPGERAALMLPTGAEYFEAFLGVLVAGGVPVPVYPPARPSQIEAHMRRQAGILDNAGAAILIAPAESRGAAALLRGLAETVRGIESVAALRAIAVAEAELPAVRDAAQTALVQYTSGSTGEPKGVVLSHANLLANIRAMGEAMRASSQDVFVSWLPLYHDMGLIGAWLGSLYYGAVLSIMPPLAFLAHPAEWLWAIHDVRATLSAAPNFAFELCLGKLDEDSLRGLDLSSLRMVANGAEPVSARTVRRFVERFAPYGFRPEAMSPVYGLAENAVGLAFPPPGRAPVIDRIARAALAREGAARPARPEEEDVVELVACGQPLPGHEIRIVDEAGRETAERREGRLQFRGPSATGGYFRNPAKTAELFDGDWLDSGDKAYVASGDIYVTGRVKDIVIRAGRNVYPQEVEEAVGDVAGVRKGCVAVFGDPDPETGTERLVVMAETREADVAARQALEARIVEAVAELLQEPPDSVVLMPPRTVPKTSSGKIRRSAARQAVRAGAGAARRAVWWQVARLILSGLWPRLRRRTRAVGAILYAGWWWSVVGTVAAALWPAVVLLPSRRLRWALVGGAARAAFAVMGIPLRVSGRELLPTGPAVLVSNHSSYLDGAVVAAAIPGALTFTAKRELAGQHVVGPFLRRLGTLFVERFDPRAGTEDTKRAIAVVRRSERLVVFPEGTLLRGPGLLPFHLGAFIVAAQTGSPVVPITIRGTRSVLRGSGQWFPRRGPVEVAIAAPLPPDGTDFAAAVRLRNAARAAILEASAEPDLAASQPPGQAR